MHLPPFLLMSSVYPLSRHLQQLQLQRQPQQQSNRVTEERKHPSVLRYFVESLPSSVRNSSSSSSRTWHQQTSAVGRRARARRLTTLAQTECSSCWQRATACSRGCDAGGGGTSSSESGDYRDMAGGCRWSVCRRRPSEWPMCWRRRGGLWSSIISDRDKWGRMGRRLTSLVWSRLWPVDTGFSRSNERYGSERIASRWIHSQFRPGVWHILSKCPSTNTPGRFTAPPPNFRFRWSQQKFVPTCILKEQSYRMVVVFPSMFMSHCWKRFLRQSLYIRCLNSTRFNGPDSDDGNLAKSSQSDRGQTEVGQGRIMKEFGRPTITLFSLLDMSNSEIFSWVVTH